MSEDQIDTIPAEPFDEMFKRRDARCDCSAFPESPPRPALRLSPLGMHPEARARARPAPPRLVARQRACPSRQHECQVAGQSVTRFGLLDRHSWCSVVPSPLTVGQLPLVVMM